MRINSILLCISFIITANLFSTAKASVNQSDSLALVDLYNSTNGGAWKVTFNWLSSKPLRSWYGVTVTNNRVTSLVLRVNNLFGTIPTSIGNLKKLTTLDLNANHLSGTIPSSIGNLTELATLDLSYNFTLSGPIPFTFHKLTNLKILYLYSNQLTGTIPSYIGNFVNLTGLGLFNNQFTGTIPKSIGNLINLTNLQLYNNQLTGTIPVVLGNLVNLRFLELGGNHLHGRVPYSFRKLVNLNYLELNDNELTQDTNVDFPDFPKQLTNLYLYHNRFTFDGLEFVAQHFRNALYYQQAPIPVHRQGNTLSVYAGGTLSKNKYTWYKVGNAAGTTIKGDSTFTPPSSGQYYVNVSNGIAGRTLLVSDTIDFTVNNLIANNRVAADVNNKNRLNLKVYPNPATDIIHIQTNGTAMITLTTTTGKILLTKAINNNDIINVSKYANGTYYLSNKTTGVAEKIIIRH